MIDKDNMKALALAATKGSWQRSARLNGPFWHISSDHTIGGELCKSGRQAIASVHGESKKGATAYAAMFEANATFIAAANPAAVLELLADLDKLTQERDELRAEVERLRADAARYRHLRDTQWFRAGFAKTEEHASAFHYSGELLDNLVDAAIAAHTKAGKPA